MVKGLGKLALCAALLLALIAQAAWADCGCQSCGHKQTCGCKSCGAKQSCGCSKCHKTCGGCQSKCGNSCGCSKCGCGSCSPDFCYDCGIGGYKVDLTCEDACCLRQPDPETVCIEGWDLCKKWSDGLVHHPYELVYNGHGMLCDFGSCSAYIPCTRRGVLVDSCGCNEEEIKRPRTIPWWFNPGHGNTYLDDNGNPVCGQTMPPPPKEKPAKPETPAPPAATPPTPAPQPETPATPPSKPAPEQPTVVDNGKG